MRLGQSLTISALVLVALAAASVVHADDYPSRPVRLIVAFTPGGTADLTARLIADKMHDTLGETVAVENKPGASGAIAAQYVAQSEPDGYTLFFTTVGAVALNPAFRSDLAYDHSRISRRLARLPSIRRCSSSRPP